MIDCFSTSKCRHLYFKEIHFKQSVSFCRSTESSSQSFWLANASEILHFLKSDRHVSAFSLQAQDTLADAVQLSFKNLVACVTDELNSAMNYLMSPTGDDHPREVINILSVSMNLLRKCRVNAALTIQLFSQLFHWISAKVSYLNDIL